MLAHKLFNALGDETRLKIVKRLARKPSTIAELTELSGIKMTRQGVSKHLKTLQEANIIKIARNGRETEITLNRKAFVDAGDYLETIGSRWDHTLERLKAFVET